MSQSKTSKPPIGSQKILVPFPAESRLSGIAWHFRENQVLTYQRKFDVPKNWTGQRILLHFEACDWKADVRLNGKQLGSHTGGYDSFTFDITETLTATGEQELQAEVRDPSDSGDQPAGKQMVYPRLPFFSACSGIWQSVWLEPVPITSIESLKLIPDIDLGTLQVGAEIRGSLSNEMVEAIALDGDREIAHASAPAGQQFSLVFPSAKLWSPDNPFLYGLKITLSRVNEKLDTVTSYFGMRKISIAKDERGFPRMMLNNRRLFQIGPLDQGYWPEGIYTAPTDDALRFDIETMKRMGSICAANT